MSPGEAAHVELQPGALFADRYQIEALLGRGGMGAVYSARDATLGETIALKVMRTGEAAAALEIQRFRQEVKLARRVTHPGVARVFDIGEHAGLMYLTMELVPGETLRQVLRREGPLPQERAVRIAIALCDGLRAAHAASVVHRDLKPANVMLAEGDRAVITDFGIARSLDDAAGLTCGAIGTPSYMAPEQLVSGVIDGRTDIHALGLLLHEMLTGQRLAGFPRPGLDPALDTLIRRCTAPMPDARPASVDEVARMLSATLHPDQQSGVGAPPVAPVASLAGTSTSIQRDVPDLATRQLRPSGPPLATMTTIGPALAVLPFRYRGPRDQDDFGDAIADELVDVLARTRGVRVLGSGATARYKDARDPRTIGAELGASAVIDGTAQVSGERVRITVRLLETAGGMQIWTERYDGDLGDLLALQETIARRVAEELRLELSTLVHRGAAPAAAIELYLEGRHRLRAFDGREAVAAAETLDRCVALAPDFVPALPAHAIACLRRWFFDTQQDWETSARAAVAVALARAPELAEAHLAAGILATHEGNYRAAALAIERSLAIAPTYADAQEYLGMLQCEAGQGEDGTRRLRLACSLDPTLIYAGVFLARSHALHGKWSEAERVLDDLERRLSPTVLPLSRSLRCRFAGWRRDEAALRRLVADGLTEDTPNRRLVMLYARAFTGEIDVDEVRRSLQRIVTSTQNLRFLSLTEQLATEIFAGLGEIEEARLHLFRAATNVLVDLEWLDRCPLLAQLRTLPDWDDARRRVRARAEAVWTT